jgi:murein DD-endopeptidase MepM/ murein hydrolase activator NlpD
LEALTAANVRGLALNLSVGWPRNAGADTPPIWDSFLPLENIILKGKHFLAIHEYWYPNVRDKWGWYGNRIAKCPMAVPIIIGECGYTRQLANLPQPWGWIGNKSAEEYADELWYYHDNVAPNVFAICPFTSGYASSEWASKDIMICAPQILARKHFYTWPTGVWPIPVGAQPVEPVEPGEGDMGDPKLIILPKMPKINNFFGEIWAGISHSGIDISAATGTPIYCPYPNSVVAWVDDDGAAGYGRYIRISMPDPINCDILFGHCREVIATKGQVLAQGAVIAYSDSTGNSTGPHIHMEFRQKMPKSTSYKAGVSSHTNSSVDPFGFIAGWCAAGGKIELR